MKKETYVKIIVGLMCLLLISIPINIFNYLWYGAVSDWFKESVNDNRYIVEGKKRGDTFLFGNSKAMISIMDVKNEKTLVTFTGYVYADLNEENYDIEATDEYIKIYLIDCVGNVTSVYRFYYEDFEE